MTTTRAEFIELAEELIGDEFADFGVSSTVVKTTGWDDTGQTATTISSDAFYLIPLENEKSQFEQQNIQVGDLVTIGERQKIIRSGSLFTFGLDNSHIVYGGVNHSIINIYIYPGEPAVEFHLRPK